MAKIAGTNLAAAVVPFTTEDVIATHHAQYGKGGYRTVETNADLDKIPAQRLEVGMAVYVEDESKIWILNSRADNGTGTLVNDWIELLSNYTTSSEVDEKISALGTVFKYKGTKATIAELQTVTDCKGGDVWHITEDGSEWVCVAQTSATTNKTVYSWEELGTAVDLSDYLTKTYASSTYATSTQGKKADTALQPSDLEEITNDEINTLFA